MGYIRKMEIKIKNNDRCKNVLKISEVIRNHKYFAHKGQKIQ